MSSGKKRTRKEPLAGELVAEDLGNRVGEKRGWNERGRLLVWGRLEQLADVGGLQGRDPGQARRLEVLANAGGGDHAAVADEGDLLDAGAGAHLPHLRFGAGIAGVAGEQFDRDRTPVRGAEQAEDDLHLARFAVAVVPEGRQGAAPPFQIAGGHVVEDQGVALEMPVREAPLDPGLAFEEPVEHVEHLVARDGSETDQGAEAGIGGLRGEAPGGGQPGIGRQHAGQAVTR